LDPASYDAVVVIEALIHSPCFAKTLANLVQALKPGGHLILVEDVVRDQAKGDPDLDLMCEFWEIADLPTTSTYAREFDAQSLRVLKDRDYSADFITSPPDQLADLATRYRRFLRIPLAGVRFIAGAFLGGIALERLYQKDLVQYRLIVAQKNT
jgi:SAM-dependent methyltransferase